MNDTLQTYYDKHNYKLPTNPIPDEAEEKKTVKEALKEFTDKDYLKDKKVFK